MLTIAKLKVAAAVMATATVVTTTSVFVVQSTAEAQPVANETKGESGWVSALQAKAESIRPTADERRWMEIPWVRTAAEAVEQGKAENRLIFVFSVASKDPLGRC